MTAPWVTLSESEPTHTNRELPLGEDAVDGVRIGRFDVEALRHFSDGLAALPDDDFRHHLPLDCPRVRSLSLDYEGHGSPLGRPGGSKADPTGGNGRVHPGG
jgi:hypothetical protein